MLFKIKRTSTSIYRADRDKKPCEEAFQSKGEWFIELSNLDELISFTTTYGSCIINENEIEIYDDYKE